MHPNLPYGMYSVLARRLGVSVNTAKRWLLNGIPLTARISDSRRKHYETVINRLRKEYGLSQPS